MHTVVGCSDCGAFWVVEGDPETTRCRTCGTRHRFRELQHFVETENADAAREARAAILAEKNDREDAFERIDSFGALDREAEDAGMSEVEYAEAAGLDTEAIAAASERATQGSGGSTNRLEIVRESIEGAEPPTEENVLAKTRERGVPTEAAEEILEKLRRRGAVSESGGRYRLL